MGAGGAPVFGVPESTPASRPFSLTIRLKTSATERTPCAGFQSYLPDMTRASPVNLSERVPASVAKAACHPAGCDCAPANGAVKASASAHTPYWVRVVIIWHSFQEAFVLVNLWWGELLGYAVTRLRHAWGNLRWTEKPARTAAPRARRLRCGL